MLNLTGMGGQARREKGLSTDGSDDTDGRASPPGEMPTDDTRVSLMALTSGSHGAAVVGRDSVVAAQLSQPALLEVQAGRDVT
jgi:hypothetical protein